MLKRLKEMEKENSEDRIIEGWVLITRSPTRHTGDIRRVKAVFVLKYAKDRKYKNVVIFSKKGIRPLPNQMAGGDLDGDTCLVIWEPRIPRSD